MHAVESGMLAMESGMHAVESGMHAMESGMHAVECGMQAMESGMHAVESGMHAVESGMYSTESGMHRLERIAMACMHFGRTCTCGKRHAHTRSGMRALEAIMHTYTKNFIRSSQNDAHKH